MVRCCGGAGVDCETERSGAGVDCETERGGAGVEL